MCGIVGYVGQRPCLELLLDGLERLEYRGYDSAGIALVDGGAAIRVRSVGPIAALRAAFDDHAQDALLRACTSGIGHTRWATHGRVSEANAHPLSDDGDRVQLVLNGIVENHRELREQLEAEGATFASDTDAEVVAHLLARRLDEGLVDAVRLSLDELEGHFAFVAASPSEPDRLVGARRACPLVVGQGENERFLSSALVGLPGDIGAALAIGDDEIVVVDPGSTRVLDRAGRVARLQHLSLDPTRIRASLGGQESYMLAEIDEQPTALRRTLLARREQPGLDAASWAALGDAQRLSIVACGTSFHAGLVGRFLLESWAGLRVDADVASEWRYRDPDVGDVVLGITQSGETADTIGALAVARERGAHTLALTNVAGSQATRETDGAFVTEAGTEVSVAATKTFVTQVAALAELALQLGVRRAALDHAQAARIEAEVARLPDVVERARTLAEEPVRRIAELWAEQPFFLYVGRHIGLPIALEGALKLKEIAYVPAEAYAAGEMKHGPIALITEGTPVVCVATDSPLLGKLRSNLAEVRTRGARVLLIATEGTASAIAEEADELVLIPQTDPLLAPIPAIVSLQLLAYRIARARGLDADRPRNLAKTVTVE
jgi:glucosamine--fructose-6-phosphate aminotransferase (isomerizing)